LGAAMRNWDVINLKTIMFAQYLVDLHGIIQ
jgi:hypothetical protein